MQENTVPKIKGKFKPLAIFVQLRQVTISHDK